MNCTYNSTKLQFASTRNSLHSNVMVVFMAALNLLFPCLSVEEDFDSIKSMSGLVKTSLSPLLVSVVIRNIVLDNCSI